MDRLQVIETFVRVAQTQSFAEAARQLRIARSAATTRVKKLEEYVGAPLFHRTTRMVRLTELGQAYLLECVDLITRANGVVDHMRDAQGQLSGALHIHALAGLVLGRFAEFLHEFKSCYPDIRLNVTVSDDMVDPVKAGVDCVLQIFPPASSELISRRLYLLRRVFCASPRYLARFGRPKEPRDLHKHSVGVYSGYPSRDRWTFYRRGEQTTLYLTPSMLTNSVHLLRELALEDDVIVCLPTLAASNELLRGDLEVVMPDYDLSSLWLRAVYASTSRNAFKLRLFVEMLISTFNDVPSWDADLIAKGLLNKRFVEPQE
ncbi:MAG TPA: LysR family transcriptional regulator [Eoetvoesiella sp.]|jgi:DNA-binding transcriptional LysR family regulator|uniref:LysR family transcriptional regulator n=1 Tax=Eoetvoesiella sp. TaxID=1966355 RepID=UPI002C93A920|nr:LysR family transcriptional regulator [Eoetvoesiella sp.]HWK60004.1 LysR family transcriptional regulator [Eoetvoesiella sp.]